MPVHPLPIQATEIHRPAGASVVGDTGDKARPVWAATVIAIALLLALAGCVSNAERAAAASAEIDRMIEVYGPACEKLGYPRDTDRWRDCVLQLAARADDRFYRSPATTTCIGHRGFFHCSRF